MFLISRRFKEKVVATDTGFCVYSTGLLDKRVGLLTNPHKYRDLKTKNGTEALKQRARYQLKKNWKKIECLAKQGQTTYAEQKEFIIASNTLQKKYYLKPRTDSGDAVSKLELMKDIVAPFALEVRDNEFLKYFVENGLWDSDHLIYLAGGFFLRDREEVVNNVTAILLLNIKPDSLRKNSLENNFAQVGVDPETYQKTYHRVDRAYDFIDEEYRARIKWKISETKKQLNKA